MKKLLILAVLFSASLLASGEEPWSLNESQQKYPARAGKNFRPKSVATSFPKWAVHSNLLGFVQFGPVVSAEYNLTRHLAFSAHARFSSVGALTPYPLSG